jgi:xylulokinase
MGERSPINDTNARGTFIGMSMDTKREELILAVLEGVAFALRDSIEVARSLGIEINVSKLCGGGAKSPLWRKILAAVLNIELEIPKTEQGPSMGGAMLAMVASGEYRTVADACAKLCEVKETVKPDKIIVDKYETKYQKYKKIYPNCKELFAEITQKE